MPRQKNTYLPAKRSDSFTGFCIRTTIKNNLLCISVFKQSFTSRLWNCHLGTHSEPQFPHPGFQPTPSPALETHTSSPPPKPVRKKFWSILCSLISYVIRTHCSNSEKHYDFSVRPKSRFCMQIFWLLGFFLQKEKYWLGKHHRSVWTLWTLLSPPRLSSI